MSEVYSPHKFLRFQDRIDAWRQGRLAAPVHVRIKPYNHCNHNCWYCAYRNDALHLGDDMDEKDQLPAAKMAEIVEDLIEMKVKAVTFSGGGEPLLYKPLPETVEALAKGGIRIGSLTNGSNLKGRVAEALARHATWVRVSVDAWDNDSYVKSRGARPGDFDRLIANMRAFVATGTKCVLGVSYIVGHDNHAHLADICRIFKDVGVNHVKVAAAVVANDVAANNRYHQQIMAEVTRQIETAKALDGDGFRVVNHYHETDERFEKHYHTCPFLQFLTVIGADQCVYTCQDKAYTKEGMLGSIAGRRFKDFWFSEDNRAMVHGFDPSVNCQHHCVAHVKNLALHSMLDMDPDHEVFV